MRAQAQPKCVPYVTVATPHRHNAQQFVRLIGVWRDIVLRSALLARPDQDRR
jgi:hypothetical protein